MALLLLLIGGAGDDVRSDRCRAVEVRVGPLRCPRDGERRLLLLMRRYLGLLVSSPRRLRNPQVRRDRVAHVGRSATLARDTGHTPCGPLCGGTDEGVRIVGGSGLLARGELLHEVVTVLGRGRDSGGGGCLDVMELRLGRRLLLVRNLGDVTGHGGLLSVCVLSVRVVLHPLLVVEPGVRWDGHAGVEQ